jgi:hypothetical protein
METLRAFCNLGWRKFCCRREVFTANKRCLTRSSVSGSDDQPVGESSEVSDRKTVNALRAAESTAERNSLFV